MTLTVPLPDDLERRLRESASRDGRPVEDVLLDELASGPGLPRLAAEFSRTDICAYHD